MERRDDALREALLQNAEETQRWESYKKENESAVENLREFSKHLSVDVMVPIGKKALMPGQLIHTNEILVGHYQGYFSKCSAHKAMEICELRLSQAKEQIKKLEIEEKLWQNKLEKPYMEGVLPGENEREIIEDYDEEKEKRWREEHKLMVKRAKRKEKEDREAQAVAEENKASTVKNIKNDNDILKMLEEAELMEELENELGKLEVDEISDETIRMLMAGEKFMSKPKNRSAHETKEAAETTISKTLNGVFKKTAAETREERKSPATNNNTRINHEIHLDDEEENEVEDDDLTEEVRLIRDQAKFLPASEQVGFYGYQLEIIRNKIAQVRLTKESDIEEKLHLMTVRGEIEDLLAMAEEECENESESEINVDLNEDTAEDHVKNNIMKAKQKRRIAFALEDETLIFRNTEAVSQMLPKPDNGTKNRDIITIDSDDDMKNESTKADVLYSRRDKTQSILEKVQKNRQFITEIPSKEDCDLVKKIIDETTFTAKTIFIKFKHSEQQGQTDSNDSANHEGFEISENFIPEKPSDFLNLYLKQQQKSTAESTIYVNGYIGEEEVKAPILKEANREFAYEDPRSKFSVPTKSNENQENAISTKSILRNKSAVEKEFHFSESTANKKQKKKKVTFDEDEYMSAYWKVMNDVVEKPLREPEPLPNENFIDAHAPKKRISRFKQMRSENGKTTAQE